MKFRTEISPERSELRIDYQTPLFFTGSCFSEEIGLYLERGKFDIEINPFGVLYNPVSVANALDRIIDGAPFNLKDLYQYNDRYLSFHHDTSFSSESADKTLEAINSKLEEASLKLRKAKYLFVTFGTARIFRLNSSGQVVSNCHKIPADRFTRVLLDVDNIVELWTSTIERIRSQNPNINIIFTVSPVRHWKDGAHGNQLSKSTLFVAIEKLIAGDPKLSYFPSYELMMDDLRDYRFYNSDLLHPSPAAIKYIWEYFTSIYIDKETMNLYKEIERIITGKEHRISGNNLKEINVFKTNMINRINSVLNIAPYIDFDLELKYFQEL